MSHKTTAKSNFFKTKSQVIDSLTYLKNNGMELEWQEDDRTSIVDSGDYGVKLKNFDILITNINGREVAISITVEDNGIKIEGDFWGTGISDTELKEALETGRLEDFLEAHFGDNYQIIKNAYSGDFDEYLDEEELAAIENGDYLVYELEV